MPLAGFLRLACTALLAVCCGAVPSVWAQAARCPDGKAADGIERVGNSLHCLVVRRIDPEKASTKLLVVYLHGDNGGRIDMLDDRNPAPVLASQLKAVTVALQRPGYTSALGQSDGQGSPQDDDYTEGNLRILADAMQNLRTLNPGKKILLIGHSGGAAMTALLAARFPASADAWLLAACPCDVPAWRVWRNSSTGKSGVWSRSLSPLAEVSKIAPATRIALVVGNKDDNTLPKFSETYAAALQARGVKTRVTYAVGASHSSVRWSPEFLGVAQDLADSLVP